MAFGTPKKIRGALLTLTLLCAGASHAFASGMAVFNVKDYGATGKKADDAEAAIQKAIDAASDNGGGTVYLPPGAYTSGTLRLKSHVNIYLEAGATLYATENWHAFDVQKIHSKDSLFWGEDLDDISIGGRGTIDGQMKYVWRQDDFEHDFDHKILMKSLGKSLMRTFPAGDMNKQIYPHLLALSRCTNVRITGVQFLHSPSWTFCLYGCSRVVIDGIYVYTSLKEAVWADGIDMDSCHDVSISNSTIATGDDCIIFISLGIDNWGPALPCENITITNCRLSSASAAIKFSEGCKLIDRNVVISNCVIFDCNRGITLQINSGGTISDVVISNLVINTHRFDWFWAGDGNAFNFFVVRNDEWDKEPKRGGPYPGVIRNVIIRDVIVHGQGTSRIQGHPDSWLDGVTFENIKYFLSTDPSAPYDTSTDALYFRWARNLKVRNVEVYWDKPLLDKWQSALHFEEIDHLQLDGFSGNSAWPDKNIPAVAFNHVTNATVRDSDAVPGTNIFLKVSGSDSHDIRLFGNDFHEAKVPYVLDSDVKPDAIAALDNFLPAK